MNALKRMIPNLFTAGNLVGGILAIIFTLTGRIEIAPYCIFASAIFDFLDGFMARLLKVPSEMGKQLDSLADMVTFGVAPGIMVYAMIGKYNNVSFYHQDFLPSSWSLPFYIEILKYSAFLIPVFALFRLAKFNLDTRQSDSFIGLPTPAMTLFFAVMPLLLHNAIDNLKQGENILENREFIMINLILNPWFLSISALIMSILMVVELPLFALKFKHFKWKGNEIRFIFLTCCVAMLATLFFWALPLIIILYVLLSIINNQFVKAKTNEI